MKPIALAIIISSAYVLWLGFVITETKRPAKRQAEPVVQIYTDHGIVTKAKQ